MVISEIKLYELLKAKIGEKEAEAFVEILERKVDKKFEERKSDFATKEDISGLRTELLRTIYITSLGQLLAIVGSVIGIILALK
ncbi:MAG TPA: hypothetical protein PL009_07330 [Flavipsychrobacter sp.]|nr:hypothetical protein [Flavipsychrobacter sp.]